jgi:heme/copper-type cytochrome/quinol oxidase subunit 2
MCDSEYLLQKIGKMKKILKFQTIANALILIFCLLYTAGNMVDIKYNYDVPFADFNNVGQDFHSMVTYYCSMIFVIIAINVFCSFIVYRKYKNSRDYTPVMESVIKNVELTELYN